MDCEHQHTEPLTALNGHRCRDCGEVFLSPKPSDADRIGFDAYANEYD